MRKPDMRFAKPASDKRIRKTRDTLEKNGIRTHEASDKKEAVDTVFSIIPSDAEVFTMTSMTLETLGIPEKTQASSTHTSVRNKLEQEDISKKEKREIGAAPEWAIGSVHAVTENGEVLIASNTGSQLPAYAYAAEHVLWVVGTQKIVTDLDEGLKRIYTYSLPLEHERAQKAYGTESNVSKLLIVNKEVVSDRIHLLFVRQNIGF